MKSGSLLVVLVALGCSRHHGVAGVSADGASAPERDAAAVTADAPAPPDRAVDLVLPDAGPPPPAEEAYRSFIAMYNDGYARRLVGCFNYTASSVAGGTYRELVESIISSLRVGLVGWDSSQAARCLEALASAGCDDIVSGRALVACDRVLVGKVADDGYCLNDVDCREPGHVCGSSALSSCGTGCQRSLDPTRVGGADGQPCTGYGCQPGLFCWTSGFNTGDYVCRPIAAGTACESRWQCAHPYTCVADAAGKGTCGPGKAPGQPCHVWADPPFHGVDSDCPFDATCKSIGGGPEVCVPGSPPAPPQPAPPELDPGAICLSDDTAGRCRPGSFCRVDPAELMKEPPQPRYRGVCQPWRKRGDVCEDQGACEPGLTCLHGTCTACPGGAGPSPDGGAPDGGRSSDAGCSGNLATDPANCGACGRSCLGGACFDGQCQARAIGSGIDNEIASMAIDETGVYLAEEAQRGRILRVTPDGSQPYQVLAADQDLPRGLALDATHVYWVNNGGGEKGSVNRMLKAGGPVEVLAPDETAPTKVVLDGTHIYWSNSAEGPFQGVRRLARQGGVPETFATGLPADVAVDATDVYWPDQGAGTINRRAKTGGPIKVLVSDEEAASHVALDDRRVYWSSFKHIASMPKAGGPVFEHAQPSNVADLASDGEALYWATTFEIGRSSAGGLLLLVDSTALHQIEVRGPWLYFVAGQSLLRIPK